MPAPEAIGWLGAFIVWGVIALIAMAPALLVILVWHTPLRRHALLSTTVPLFLGGPVVVLSRLIQPDALSTFIAAGALCLAIVVLLELLLKGRIQGTRDHRP